MTSVQQLLAQKGRTVLSVRPDETVYVAITKMADKDVGSLVVLEEGRLVGIITERHYARNVFLKGRSSPQTRVREVMERKVVCVHPSQSVEECMALMNAKRVRHLPVIDDGTLLGIVSIGDLVDSISATSGRCPDPVNRRGIFTPDRCAVGTPLVAGVARVEGRSCGA